jgi:hypothetical protein
MDLRQPVAWCIRTLKFLGKSHWSHMTRIPSPSSQTPRKWSILMSFSKSQFFDRGFFLGPWIFPWETTRREERLGLPTPSKEDRRLPDLAEKKPRRFGEPQRFLQVQILGKKVGKGASKPSKFGGFSKLFGYQTDFLRTLGQIPQAESGTNQLASLIRWSKWYCFGKLDGSVWYTISIDCLLVVSISSPTNIKRTSTVATSWQLRFLSPFMI